MNWINVHCQLPPDDTICWVYQKGRHQKIPIAAVYYEEDDEPAGFYNLFGWEHIRLADVTHWMAMPEPPSD